MALAIADFFRQSNPVVQAFIATVGTYLLTALGTLPVLFFRSAPRRVMDAMMGEGITRRTHRNSHVWRRIRLSFRLPAVGVSFGGRDLGAAIALAIGIGLQNIPEGLAIALPLRRGGMSRGRAFFWGQLSAAIEPIAGALGAALVLASSAFLPIGMAAAAPSGKCAVTQPLTY
jgi:zinc transporter ZupT